MLESMTLLFASVLVSSVVVGGAQWALAAPTGFKSFPCRKSSWLRPSLSRVLSPLMPTFQQRLHRHTDSVEDVWSELTLFAEQCGFKAIGWKTVGYAQSSSRKVSLGAKGKKSKQRGFVRTKSSGRISGQSFVEIEFVVPRNLGNVSTESYDLLRDVANSVGTALEKF